MTRSMKSVSLEEAFFEVEAIDLSRQDNSETLRGHKAIVARGSRDAFAVVTANYQLVTNQRACELGHEAFALIFGDDAAKGLRPFNVLMPRTRSWVQVDFTADQLSVSLGADDRWLPFLRVTNSYNKTKALQFTVGVCRWICTNGMIFGDQSLTLRNTHQRGVDLGDLLRRAFTAGAGRMDLSFVKSRLEKLKEHQVSHDQFLAAMLEILELSIPPSIPESPLHARGWKDLGPHLSRLGQSYASSLGDNAYALLNAASDYASDVEAPRMNPTLVNGYQARCGRWAAQLGELAPAEPACSVSVQPENLKAASRLMSFSSKN